MRVEDGSMKTISYDIAADANGKELLCPFCCL